MQIKVAMAWHTEPLLFPCISPPDHVVNGLIWPGHVPGSSLLCDHKIAQVGGVGVGMVAGAEWELPLPLAVFSGPLIPLHNLCFCCTCPQ